MTLIKNSSDLIISELYKTNLKFRTTNTGVIEILNQHFTPIAAIFPVYQHQSQSTTTPTSDPQ